jgi:hypothetical protein
MMRPGKLILTLAGFALAAGSAIAADPPASGAPPERISALTVYGDDPCPRSSGDEIVVCARQPESERFRVPKRFRNQRKRDPGGTAWGARVQTLEYVSRTGRPNSCSPVGSFGQTGCTQQFLSQWRAERNQAKEDDSSVP